MILIRLTILFVFFALYLSVNAQKVIEYQADVTRILFLVDGSGSMKQSWEGSSKFEIAREMIFEIVDSLEQEKIPVEFAVRVFGHQSPRSLNDCEDSNLEIPFSKNNAARIRQILNDVNPKGHTPIAYSLYLSAKDFPEDKISTNAIIIITDGEENCNGDPCDASKLLEKKRITLKPYIIGLGESSASLNFDCVGKYISAKNKKDFGKAIDIIVTQTLNATTVQVNFLNKEGMANITDLPFTLYDHYSGEIKYNFVHTLNTSNEADTLYLDPRGVYDLELHTKPSIRKEEIRLVAGKHNIIALKVPVGTIGINRKRSNYLDDMISIVREANAPYISFVQYENSTVKYLTGDFDLESLTLPIKRTEDIYNNWSQVVTTEIPADGELSFANRYSFTGSLYLKEGDEFVLIKRLKAEDTKKRIRMLPGNYYLVYKFDKDKETEFTKTVLFEIESGRHKALKL